VQELHDSHVHQSIAYMVDGSWTFIESCWCIIVSSVHFVSTEESTDIIGKTGVFAYFVQFPGVYACCDVFNKIYANSRNNKERWI